MDIVNDRKAAIKKLKLLTYGPKSNVDSFRAKLDENIKTLCLPNGVERISYKYGNVDCDVLAPEIYSSNRVMLYIHGGSYVGGLIGELCGDGVIEKKTCFASGNIEGE